MSTNLITRSNTHRLFRFAYRREVELTDLGNLYILVRDFGADRSLLKELSSIADNALTLDNAMTIYTEDAKTTHRFKHPAESLCPEVVQLVQAHTFYVVNTPAFLQIGQRGLLALLKDHNLFIKEKDLYYAVMRWIEADLRRKKTEPTLEKRRTRFAPFKPFVRFCTMTANEVACLFDDFHLTTLYYQVNPLLTCSSSFFGTQFFESDDPNSACRFEVFSDEEVKQYRRYFFGKDRDALPPHIPDSLKQARFPASIGRLLLRPDKDYKFSFEMSTVGDDLHDRAERDKFDPFRVCNDTECQVSEIGDNFGHNFGQRPPPTVEAKSDNLEARKKSIKVFRMQATHTA